MNRRQAITLGIFVLLVIGNVAYFLSRDRGLITVHANPMPLREVVLSIAKQGGIELRSDLDPETPVNMNVTKVALTEALETLATTTDARWRVQYFLAPEKATLQTGLTAFATGKMDGWKTVQFGGMPFGGVESDTPIDPRREPLTLTPPTDATLQGYLDSASKLSDASFRLPETWNPAVSSAPASGLVAAVIPKLAKSAGGLAQEVFTLSKQRGGWGGDGPGRGGEEMTDAKRDEFRAIMRQRQQAQIAALPAAEQPAAQADLAEQQKFWESVRDLPRAEREAKFAAQMADPQVQSRMADRMERSDSRRTPAQRVDRYRRYVERKAQMESGTNKTN